MEFVHISCLCIQTRKACHLIQIVLFIRIRDKKGSFGPFCDPLGKSAAGQKDGSCGNGRSFMGSQKVDRRPMVKFECSRTYGLTFRRTSVHTCQHAVVEELTLSVNGCWIDWVLLGIPPQIGGME